MSAIFSFWLNLGLGFLAAVLLFATAREARRPPTTSSLSHDGDVADGKMAKRRSESSSGRIA
jgi:hypothetical protein